MRLLDTGLRISYGFVCYGVSYHLSRRYLVCAWGSLEGCSPWGYSLMNGYTTRALTKRYRPYTWEGGSWRQAQITPVCFTCGESWTTGTELLFCVWRAFDDKVLGFFCVCSKVWDWCASEHNIHMYFVLSWPCLTGTRHVFTWYTLYSERNSVWIS